MLRWKAIYWLKGIYFSRKNHVSFEVVLTNFWMFTKSRNPLLFLKWEVVAYQPIVFLNTLSNNPTKWSNTLKQFISKLRIVWVCLTQVDEYHLVICLKKFLSFICTIQSPDFGKVFVQWQISGSILYDKLESYFESIQFNSLSFWNGRFIFYFRRIKWNMDVVLDELDELN